MRRIAGARILSALGVGLAAWAAESSAVADGPALTPPVLSGPVVDPPGELPRSLEATPMPGSGPILVVPGITAPRAGERRRTPAPPQDAPRSAGGPLPLLAAPAEPSNGFVAPGSSTTRRPPMVLESIPKDLDERDLESSSPSDPQRRGLSLPRNSLLAPSRRPGGLFNRLFQSPPTYRGDRAGISVEPRSDPAADAALQRRVEAQIRDSVGTRVRSYEVRVVGGEVAIVARPSRFWQRRSVKSALESLPALKGAKANVEVID